MGVVFRISATLGLVADFASLIYFVTHTHRLVDIMPIPSWIRLFRLAHSFFPFVILAAIRVLTLMVYIQLFTIGAHFPNISNLYWWIVVNLVVISLNWLLLTRSDFVLQQENWVFIGAYTALLCHVICIRHLRSSVVMIPSFALGLTDKLSSAMRQKDGDRRQSSFDEDYQLMSNKSVMELDSGLLEDGIIPPLSTPSPIRRVPGDQQTSRILYSLRKKVANAQRTWNASLSDFKYSLLRKYDNIALLGYNSPSGKLFYQVFSIFIDDNINRKKKALKQVEQIFHHAPDEIVFFIPQLVVYLLYGAFELEAVLQQSLLQMCRQNLTFAYKFEWYLQSFCLPWQEVVRSSIHESFHEDSWQLIFDLIQLVRKEGEFACKKIINTPQYDSFNNPSYGSIPRAIEKYPLYLTKEILHLGCLSDSGLSSHDGYRDVYMGQIRFWEKLVDLSKQIISIAANLRRSALSHGLQRIVDEFLPSAIIHVPFHNSNHRIYNIQIEECFAFSTKDRAPLLICLEVVHFDVKPRMNAFKKHWWNLSGGKSSSEKTPFYIQQEKWKKMHKIKATNEDIGASSTHDLLECESKSLIIKDGGSHPSQSLYDDQDSFYQSSSAISRKNSLENFIFNQTQKANEGGNISSIHSEIKIGSAKDPFGQWSSPLRELTWSIHHHHEDSSKTIVAIDLHKSIQQPEEDLYVSPIKGSLNTNLLSDFELEASFESMPAHSSQAASLLSWPATSSQQPPILSLEKPDTGPSSINTGSVDLQGLNMLSPDSLTYSTEISSQPMTENNSPKPPSPIKRNITKIDNDDIGVVGVGNSIIFKEKWRDKENRIREMSPVGKCLGWNLIPVIVKSNDDLRQEQLASQAIRHMHAILTEAKIDCWLRPYEIIALSSDSGIIEAIPNTVSLDVLKRPEFGYSSLANFFEEYFGPPQEVPYCNAIDNFIQSMAGYSIVCYLLNIKDRHNGNILLTTHGHVIHIDFGFMLEKTPGGNIGFEAAPFKLTSEYVNAMGGESSKGFKKFRNLCIKTFLELRRHYERVILMMEMMSKGNENLPCFGGNPNKAFHEMRQRFFPDMNDIAATEAVNNLINRSLDNWTTRVYDGYQRCCQGIQ